MGKIIANKIVTYFETYVYIMSQEKQSNVTSLFKTLQRDKKLHKININYRTNLVFNFFNIRAIFNKICENVYLQDT